MMNYGDSNNILLGNNNTFIELVQNKVIDINIKNATGRSLLHGNPSKFKVLIPLGIDVDAQDDDGNTWLHNLDQRLVQEYFGYLLNSVDTSTETDSSAKKDEPEIKVKKFNPNLKNKAGNSLLMNWSNVNCITDLLILDEKYFSEPLRYMDIFENYRFKFTVKLAKELIFRHANSDVSKGDQFDISRLLLNPRILMDPEILAEVLKYDPDPFVNGYRSGQPMDCIYEYQILETATILQKYEETYFNARNTSDVYAPKYKVFSTCIVKISDIEEDPLIKKLRKDGETFDKLKALLN